MSDPNEKTWPQDSETKADIQPSWKPLIWFVAVLTTLIALGEIFLEVFLEVGELLLELIELVYLGTVEAPEEMIEDKVEEWLSLDPYHAEVLVFWTLTPLKILIGFLLLRWVWKLLRKKLFPKAVAWIDRQWTSVRLAWRELAWLWKILVIVVTLAVFFLLI